MSMSPDISRNIFSYPGLLAPVLPLHDITRPITTVSLPSHRRTAPRPTHPAKQQHWPHGPSNSNKPTRRSLQQTKISASGDSVYPGAECGPRGSARLGAARRRDGCGAACSVFGQHSWQDQETGRRDCHAVLIYLPAETARHQHRSPALTGELGQLLTTADGQPALTAQLGQRLTTADGDQGGLAITMLTPSAPNLPAVHHSPILDPFSLASPRHVVSASF